MVFQGAAGLLPYQGTVQIFLSFLEYLYQNATVPEAIAKLFNCH